MPRAAQRRIRRKFPGNVDSGRGRSMQWSADRTILTTTELPDSIDVLFGALSAQTLVSVAGLRRMLPGVLTSSEIDQLRHRLLHSCRQIGPDSVAMFSAYLDEQDR
ncbi:hypothetical protein [Nocardia sp. NPDC057440]|uniref:hypothetical protein n=1 Tax=Nocardia sp. NPDC057440 TaxID=3346134 RepID=UPI00366A92DF